MTRTIIVVSMICFLLTFSGCVTQQHLAVVQNDLEKVRADLDKEMQKNREAIKTLDKQVQGLQRSVPDVLASNDELQREFEIIKSRIEEIQNNFIGSDTGSIMAQLNEIKLRLNALENYVTTALPGSPPFTGGEPGKSDPKEDYETAYLAFNQGNFEKANELFGQFLVQHPESELADEVQYYIGECFYALKQYERAILEFDEVIKKYPKSPKIPESMLKQGFSFYALGDYRNSQLILEGVIQMFPNSDQAKMAKRKLETFKK